jgi:5'-deoxynucleotidase YfbR-like HD superfamily hydrolase
LTDTGWIQTFTGKKFYPLAPRVEDVDLKDIAHALGMLCRFGGHTHRFYSVAEHSYFMSRQMLSMDHARQALLHDAAEAYLVDVPRPIKRQLGAVYRDAENALLRVIFEKVGLQPWSDDEPLSPEVRELDARMLLTERAEFMPNTVHGWSEVDHLEPVLVQLYGWQPKYAGYVFLARLRELFPPEVVGAEETVELDDRSESA